jgi:hypothetical protein
MSERPYLHVDEVIALCKALSPEDQEKVRRSLNAEVKPVYREEAAIKHQMEIVESHWITLDEAADNLLKSKSQVSRDAASGKLLTNGKLGRHFRVFRPSVALANAREALRCLQKALGQPEDPEAMASSIQSWMEDQGQALTRREIRRLGLILRGPGACHEWTRELIEGWQRVVIAQKRWVDVLWEKHRPK